MAMMLIAAHLFERPVTAPPVLIGPMAIMKIEDAAFVPDPVKAPEAKEGVEKVEEFEKSTLHVAPVDRSKITLMNGNIMYVHENMLHFQGLL